MIVVMRKKVAIIPYLILLSISVLSSYCLYDRMKSIFLWAILLLLFVLTLVVTIRSFFLGIYYC